MTDQKEVPVVRAHVIGTCQLGRSYFSRKLGTTAMTVWTRLLRRRDAEGVTHATIEGIAHAKEGARLTYYAVRMALRKLRTLGLVEDLGFRPLVTSGGETEVYYRVVRGDLCGHERVRVPVEVMLALEKMPKRGGKREGAGRPKVTATTLATSKEEIPAQSIGCTQSPKLSAADSVLALTNPLPGVPPSQLEYAPALTQWGQLEYAPALTQWGQLEYAPALTQWGQLDFQEGSKNNQVDLGGSNQVDPPNIDPLSSLGVNSACSGESFFSKEKKLRAARGVLFSQKKEEEKPLLTSPQNDPCTPPRKPGIEIETDFFSDDVLESDQSLDLGISLDLCPPIWSGPMSNLKLDPLLDSALNSPSSSRTDPKIGDEEIPISPEGLARLEALVEAAWGDLGKPLRNALSPPPDIPPGSTPKNSPTPGFRSPSGASLGSSSIPTPVFEIPGKTDTRLPGATPPNEVHILGSGIQVARNVPPLWDMHSMPFCWGANGVPRHPYVDEVHIVLPPLPRIPRGLDEEEQMIFVVRWYRRVLLSRAIFCPPTLVTRGTKSYFLAAAEVFSERDIRPGAFIAWALDRMLLAMPKAARSKVTPRVKNILSLPLLTEKLWMYTDTLSGNEVARYRHSHAGQEFRERMERAKGEVLRLRSKRTVENTREVFVRHFPEGYETALREVARKTEREGQEVQRRIDAGEWFWPIPRELQHFEKAKACTHELRHG